MHHKKIPFYFHWNQEYYSDEKKETDLISGGDIMIGAIGTVLSFVFVAAVCAFGVAAYGSCVWGIISNSLKHTK